MRINNRLFISCAIFTVTSICLAQDEIAFERIFQNRNEIILSGSDTIYTSITKMEIGPDNEFLLLDTR